MAEASETTTVVTDAMVNAYALGRWRHTGSEAAVGDLTPQSRAAIRAALAAAAPLIAAQVLREAALKARACVMCGREHRPIPQDQRDRPSLVPQWGDPVDGHAYRRTQSAEVAAWLDGLVIEMERGIDQ